MTSKGQVQFLGEKMYNIDDKSNRTHINEETIKEEPELLVFFKKLLTESESQLLTSIIGALKINEEACTLVALTEMADKRFYVHLQKSNADKVLLLGDLSKDLDLNLDLNPYALHKLESCILIQSAPLHEIAKSVDQKRKLWESLKLMFDI